MELAQELVRHCVRSFYDTKHIIVIETLIIHSALRDDDMAVLMGMNTKDLHKLCGRLKEDRFLAVHTRSEIKEGQQRPQNRTYYYIDYRATIDAIKWRIYTIDKEIQGNTVPAAERKEYFCGRCKAEYTILEVLSFESTMAGWLCDRCKFVLMHDDGSSHGGHEQSTKLNAQFKFITSMLPKLDQVVIPENTFEKAFEVAVKVVRDETNPAYETTPMDLAASRPAAVKGLANTGPTSIKITLNEESGPSEAEQAAERQRKERIAAQNAMPVHFTHSTVTGEQIKFTAHNSYMSVSAGEDQKNTDGVSANDDGTEIDDYFARLKEEQAKEAAREQDEEGDSDDEDDDEDLGFEDVITNG
ncbi:hypothetical protein BJ878DRAFT_409345, partial [Calycina marina]